MLEYQIYKTPADVQKLIFFLHGYNDSPANHEKTMEWLQTKLHNTYIIMPQAPEICDKNPKQRQWFGMLQPDPENKRINPQTSVAQIFAIYQKAAPNIDFCAKQINSFIDDIQNKYGIDDKHTYIVGFSQGAMLAIYTAISRKSTIGGAFSLSGLVAGRKFLAKQLNSFPPIYLFHGRDDLKVQYKTLQPTVQWLKRRGLTVKTFTYPKLTHHIIEPEIEKIADIVNCS